MAMQDLKRKSPVSEPTRLNVDQFIEQAELYARGYRDNVVPLTAASTVISNKPEPMKKAGFCLSQEAIAQLDEAKHNTGISKSRLVRMLSQHFAEQSESERQALLDALAEVR